MASEPDRDLLIDFFHVTMPRKPARKPKTQYEFNGRRCEVYKHGACDWRGWFYDDQAMEYGAETKRQLLADMASGVGPMT